MPDADAEADVPWCVDDPDPLEPLTWARERADPIVRRRGYERALELADVNAGGFEQSYCASARARALAGLARDGLSSPAHAVEAAEVAARLGEGCVAQHALAEMWFDLGEYDLVRQTIIRIPRWCFRGQTFFVWRFQLWDLRTYAAYRCGLYFESLRYADAVARKMRIPGDPLELRWAPPVHAFHALLELRDGSGGARASNRAADVLRTLVDDVDLLEWFTVELVERAQAGPT